MIPHQCYEHRCLRKSSVPCLLPYGYVSLTSKHQLKYYILRIKVDLHLVSGSFICLMWHCEALQFFSAIIFTLPPEVICWEIKLDVQHEHLWSSWHGVNSRLHALPEEHLCLRWCFACLTAKRLKKLKKEKSECIPAAFLHCSSKTSVAAEIQHLQLLKLAFEVQVFKETQTSIIYIITNSIYIYFIFILNK